MIQSRRNWAKSYLASHSPKGCFIVFIEYQWRREWEYDFVDRIIRLLTLLLRLLLKLLFIWAIINLALGTLIYWVLPSFSSIIWDYYFTCRIFLLTPINCLIFSFLHASSFILPFWRFDMFGSSMFPTFLQSYLCSSNSAHGWLFLPGWDSSSPLHLSRHSSYCVSAVDDSEIHQDCRLECNLTAAGHSSAASWKDFY